MKQYRVLTVIWLWMAALMTLHAQSYAYPDPSSFHTSSVYFVTLQNAQGENITDAYADTWAVIGAFVGDDLRGVSETRIVDPTGKQKVFFIRVWGDENDPAVVTFRMRDNRLGLEYVIGTRAFGRGDEVTYGLPSNPIVLTLAPVENIRLSTTNITVLQGGTTGIRPELIPADHSELLTELRTEYVSTDTNIFTVDNFGIITGKTHGEAQVVVNMYYGELLCFSTRAYVSVLSEKVSVTGLRNDMPSTDIEVKEGEKFSLQYTVLPENATNRQVITQVGDTKVLEKIEIDEFTPATYKALKEGKTTITVTTVDGGFQLVYNVTVVENPDLVVHVRAIVVESETVSAYVDDMVYINYDVLPANATDKSVDITIDRTDVLQAVAGGYKALAVGEAHVTLTSKDNPDVSVVVTVTVKAVPPVTLAFASTDIVLSKLHDVRLALTASDADKVLANRVEIVFDQHPNSGWGTVAMAVKADATGLSWDARARYVGNYVARLRYNGVLQSSTCNIHVPAEYQFGPGWNWLSFHTVSAAQKNIIPLTKELMDRLTLGPDNGVMEIRSQNALLYYDPEVGYFGDIEALSPTEGTYKLKAMYDDGEEEESDLEPARMVITTSYEQLVNSSTLSLPTMVHGYSWATYPHELDHSVQALAPYLSLRAYDEDKIISRTGFAEFDGEDWITSTGFRFEAGQGYLYYSSSDGGEKINWGPVTLQPDGAPARRQAVSRQTAFAYNPSAYPDCMAVVARLDGVADAADYEVGAYVGGECRGSGRCASNGLMYVTVSGKPGEQVYFRLCHLPSGQYVETDMQPLGFRGSMGSHHHPVVIVPSVTGISDFAAASSLHVALQAGLVVVNGAKAEPFITIVDAQGKQVATHRGSRMVLPRLVPGVYMVQVSDGVSRTVIKVKK